MTQYQMDTFSLLVTLLCAVGFLCALLAITLRFAKESHNELVSLYTKQGYPKAAPKLELRVPAYKSLRTAVDAPRDLSRTIVDMVPYGLRAQSSPDYTAFVGKLLASGCTQKQADNLWNVCQRYDSN